MQSVKTGIMSKVIVAVTGASGSVYALRFIQKLLEVTPQPDEVALVFSENGEKVWQYELRKEAFFPHPVKVYKPTDMFAPMASGSAGYSAMVVIPCSMGTLARIATGVSIDLIGRAADVMLKERRKLILVPRELPYSLIHLQNMTKLTESGAIVLPASPSFYNHPKTIDDLVDTVVDRVLSMVGFETRMHRWGEEIV